MEENQKENGNPQIEPEIEEVVSGEDENLEDATTESESPLGEANVTPEDADEHIAESDTAEDESKDDIEESTEGNLITEGSDKSEDEASAEDDSTAVEEDPEDLDDDVLEKEEGVEEPAAKAQEDAPEVEDEHEEPTDAQEVVAKKVDEAADDREWFVIHCYSGYENKVRHNLEQRIETMGMKDKIFDVVVPTEEEIEVKDGKRRTVERRVFPGYILVQMILNEDSWYVVRNTPGVTGFVGMGNEPTPLRPEEVAKIVKRMEADAPRIKLAYTIGQKVRITDGPFNDFIGTVADIDMERAMVRVMVSFFGRDTPVELDFLQVDKA